MSPRVLVVTEAIGTAMLQHRRHALYDGGLRIAGTARYKACDPAHAAIIASCGLGLRSGAGRGATDLRDLPQALRGDEENRDCAERRRAHHEERADR